MGRVSADRHRFARCAGGDELLCSSNRETAMKKISIIGVLIGAAMVCATPDPARQSVPRQRVVDITEFRGSKNRAAVVTWECCWRQPASAPQSISPLRLWCYLLLSCAIRGRLRLGGFLLGKPLSAGSIAIHKQGGNHGPFSHSDVCWATIVAAASTSASAWHCLASSPNGSGGHRLRRHTGKSPVNLDAPVHTPRRWGWLHNRMVPAVLKVGLRAATQKRRTLPTRIHGKLRRKKAITLSLSSADASLHTASCCCPAPFHRGLR